MYTPPRLVRSACLGYDICSPTPACPITYIVVDTCLRNAVSAVTVSTLSYISGQMLNSRCCLVQGHSFAAKYAD